MAKVENLHSLLSKFQYRDKFRGTSCEGTVGYRAPYAMPVHENLAIPHANGQAKFLEQPARELRPEFAWVIRRELQAGRPLAAAVREVLGRLLTASQALVPVRTGFLRASGFVEVRDA